MIGWVLAQTKINWQIFYPRGGIQTVPVMTVVGLLGLAMVIGVLILGIVRLRRMLNRSEDQRLFDAIASQLGVRYIDRCWLEQIAERHKLCSPLVLIFSRSTLEHYVHISAKTLAHGSQQAMIRRLQRVADRIFGPVSVDR